MKNGTFFLGKRCHLKKILDEFLFCYYNKSCSVKNRTTKRVEKFGVVLVSTGIMKLKKPPAGRNRISKPKLNINANEDFAFAA